MSDCVEWTGYRNTSGYGIATHKGSKVRAHRLEWEREYGPIPEGLCVLHHCDNPPCINVKHLFLGTQRENIEDRDRKGRGAKPPSRAKLTLEQAREMRALYASGGTTQQQLADAFGISRRSVRDVVVGKSYRTQLGGAA